MNPMKATILNAIECDLKDAKVALEYYTSERGLVGEQFVLVNNDMPANMRGPFFVAGAPAFGKFVLFSKEVAEIHAAKMHFEVKHVKTMLEEAIIRNEKLIELVNQ